MQGASGDQRPKLGSTGPKMRQNHPETSLIPIQSIPKHIPKLLGGVIFQPKSPQNWLSPQTLPIGYYGSTGDQRPRLGSRGPKMRQNHPETSLIPIQSIPKHIPKLFFSGDFSTPNPPKTAKSPNSPRRLLGTYWHHAGCIG